MFEEVVSCITWTMWCLVFKFIHDWQIFEFIHEWQWHQQRQMLSSKRMPLSFFKEEYYLLHFFFQIPDWECCFKFTCNFSSSIFKLSKYLWILKESMLLVSLGKGIPIWNKKKHWHQNICKPVICSWQEYESAYRVLEWLYNPENCSINLKAAGRRFGGQKWNNTKI